jgi:FkbM family methyltransferase
MIRISPHPSALVVKSIGEIDGENVRHSSNAGQLFELNDNSGNGQLLGKGYGLQTLVTAESNIISSTTLDAVLQHDINFLKMDVEGCEGRVVAGAKCLLRAHDVRFIFFEFSAKNMQETCRWCRATTTRRFVC